MNTGIPMADAISSHGVKVSKYGVFSGPYFFVFGLNTDISKSPYSVRIQENTNLKKLCIWTLLTQCRYTYKITEDHPVAVSQTKNDHI